MKISNKILLGTALFFTVIYWIILIFRIPVFQVIPGYFWHFMAFINTPLSSLWIIVPIIGLAAVVFIMIFSKKLTKDWYILLLLIILGYVTQTGSSLMEGRGMNDLRRRMIDAGHSEFGRLAALEGNLYDISSHYEEFLQKSDSIRFANTKPPGQLLFYMLMQKISNLFNPQETPFNRYLRLIIFASFAFPLLTYLAIIPIYYFCKMFMERQTALLACLLYIFTPSVTLVTMHLDQVLYPFLFMICMFLILHACRNNRIVMTLICGAAAWIAVYVSFSLLTVIPAVLFCIIAYSLSHSGVLFNSKSTKITVAFAGGLVLLQLLSYIALNYDIFVRYHNAMAYHQSWKEWESGWGSNFLYAGLNFIEFACWIGLPIAIFFGAAIVTSIRNIVRKIYNFDSLLTLITALLILILGFFGKTKSEVGRLWIFMMPMVCIVVVADLSRRFKGNTRWIAGGLLTLQLITILLMKRFQDFW